jgi:hypothetical protein
MVQALFRFRANLNHLKSFQGLPPESPGQNLAVTVLCDCLVSPRRRSHMTRRCRGVTHPESYITKHSTYSKNTRSTRVVRGVLAEGVIWWGDTGSFLLRNLFATGSNQGGCRWCSGGGTQAPADGIKVVWSVNDSF